MSNFISTMRLEAEALAQQVATLRPQRAALATAAAAAEDGYQAALERKIHGIPSNEADRAHQSLQDYRQRLARCESDLMETESRYRDLARLLDADQSTGAVAETVRTAGLAVVALHDQLDRNASAITRMTAMQATEATAAQAARAALAAQAVGTLPEEVRALIGASAPELGAVAADPTPHDQRAAALGEAIDRLEAIAGQLHRDLDAAVTAHQAAQQQQREHAACIAELRHAEALASYLPSLMAFRAAHQAAFDDAPVLPNLKTICLDWREPVEVTAQPEDGPLRRGLKRLQAAAGF